MRRNEISTVQQAHDALSAKLPRGAAIEVTRIETFSRGKLLAGWEIDVVIGGRRLPCSDGPTAEAAIARALRRYRDTLGREGRRRAAA